MDLQTYLRDYEARHPENVLHVERQIDCRHIATSLVAKLEKQNRFPVLVLDRVVNILGQESPYPVVTNLLSSRSRCAEIIGSTYENVGYAFYQGMSQKRLKPVIVQREEAPVKQVRVVGDHINLFELPALMHHETDPGVYITGGYFTCYDPETGVDNSTLHRCWIKDKRELRVYLGRHQHARLNLSKHEQKGQDMRAAIWIGHHPAAMLGCETKQGYSESHYEAAGGFLGAPLRLVPSETLGDDFLVPADAEFVIEGVMKANCLVPEGPFGEATGHIGPQVQMPYMDVTAITHRSNAYWVDFQAGYAENRLMLGLPVEGGINAVHIADVVDGHLAALERGKTGERYILGGENLTLLELLEKIGGVVGTPAPNLVLPAWLVRAGGGLAGLLHNFLDLPVPPELFRMAGYYFYYDTRKAQVELGLAPPRPVEEAVTEAFEWFQRAR